MKSFCSIYGTSPVDGTLLWVFPSRLSGHIGLHDIVGTSGNHAGKGNRAGGGWIVFAPEGGALLLFDPIFEIFRPLLFRNKMEKLRSDTESYLPLPRPC